MLRRTLAQLRIADSTAIAAALVAAWRSIRRGLPILMVVAGASTATAQCGEWDNRLGGQLGLPANVQSIVMWDPDGPGPLPRQLVAGGSFATASGAQVNGVARWDGQAWRPVGEGLPGPVYALATWDPDGAGPEPEQLVAGGTFTSLFSPARGIARWDGSRWQPLGTGVDLPVRRITTWDPDGDGPMPAQLIVAGEFRTAGGIVVNRIARWDGSQWHALGSGASQFVWSIGTWDPDGAGPALPRLVAGGNLRTASGSPANGIAMWNGQHWEQLGAGLSGVVNAVTTWDPDGAGPMPARLIAGGRFGLPGTAAAGSVAEWDGSTWRLLSIDGTSDVYWLTEYDPDGAGPAGVQLIAGGFFTSINGVGAGGVAAWNGTAWAPVGDGLNGEVYALMAADLDGEGPMASELVAAGQFVSAEGRIVNRIARWNNSRWQAFGTGMDSVCLAITTWDFDGVGPEGPQIVATGSFTSDQRSWLGGIARWTDAGWQSIGGGMNGTVATLCAWDSDGEGPAPPLLIAGGQFSTAGGTACNSVAAWNGSAWMPIGSGLTGGRVLALHPWDSDGGGPAPARLIAGGSFVAGGTSPVSYLAWWDDGAWRPLGGGVDSTVNALHSWDPDGDGPQGSVLVVGGRFASAGGVAANSIACWNGQAWFPLGSGMNGAVRALATWDPDGAGPLAPELVATGEFTLAGGNPANRVARWDGIAWRPFGAGMNGPVSVAAVWDPDGPGPSAATLVAGGTFTTAGGSTVKNIAHWTGTDWRGLGDGTNSTVAALGVWEAGVGGVAVRSLVAGGLFTAAGKAGAGYVALWVPGAAPQIVAQPLGSSVDVGSSVSIAAAAVNGLPSVRWTRNGTPISNGPGGASPGGGTVYGAVATTVLSGAPVVLTIANAQRSDAGVYAAVFTNACGITAGDVAKIVVTVGACNHADVATEGSSQPLIDGPDGMISCTDFDVFVQAFFQEIRRPAGTGPFIADLTDGDGTGGPDGFITGSDFDFFIVKFFAGCP